MPSYSNLPIIFEHYDKLLFQVKASSLIRMQARLFEFHYESYEKGRL